MQAPRTKSRDFFRWLWAVADLHARHEEKSILLILALHANENGECFPGETTLCREAGFECKRTLRRWIRRLEAPTAKNPKGRGWIKTRVNSRPVRIGDKTFYANSYTLTIPTRGDSIVSAHDAESGGQIERDGETNRTPRGDNSSFRGGHNSVRQMTNRMTNRMTKEKGGADTRQNRNEFKSIITPRIIL